ncbi:MAG: LysR family transcriptional regulator [Kofleriaceae bacterium]
MLEEPDLVVLSRVIDRGSFARAALELGVPASTLSRRVAALEERLGIRAIERTTRSLRATEVGELLAARGRRVRAELEDAERVVADHRETPRGTLRLAIPTPAQEFVAPILATILARYPELKVEIGVSDQPLELLANGFDAALYGGAIRGSSTYGVTKLGNIGPVLAASQDYLDRSPAIRHPRDLADPAHVIIARSRRSTWEFVHGKSKAPLSIQPAPARVVVGAKMFSAELVSAGIGLAFIARSALAERPHLRELEPAGYRPAGGPFSLVTPSARTAAPKVRAFADATRAFIATRPDLFI